MRFRDYLGSYVSLPDSCLFEFLSFLESLRYGTHNEYQSITENPNRKGADTFIDYDENIRYYVCCFYNKSFTITQRQLDRLIVRFTHKWQEQERALDAWLNDLFATA